MIDRLREVLGAVSPHGAPDARELSELLWLAAHIAPARDEPAAPAPEPAPPVADGPPPVGSEVLAEPPGPAPEPRTALHHRPATGTAPPAGTAAEVLVPTAPMLSDPLGVQRALRPVKRRVPSRHRRELDEDATAERIADTRLWTPVLVPESERWLTLTLVVDTGPTMRLWRPLARELTETLLRQGAFQNVNVAYLTATGRVSSAPGSAPRAPGTLQDASGRHAVLLLSDCSGPHWWNGRAAPAVRRWAQAGPTAILQPLAESLWRRTAAPTTPGAAVLPRPGGPNTGLRFTPLDGAPPPGVPVPVLEVAPRWFGAWARLVSGAGPQPAAIAALPSGPSGPAPSDRDVPVAERVRRFLRTASSDAAELAAHVAVSVPSLPVMRLIQHGVLGGSDPGRLAEVLLSGLLRPLDDVRYEFVPGAREALLDTLPRPEAQHTRRVLEAVSAEIERRAGGTAETFRALLATAGGPLALTADTPHFALLAPPAPAARPAPASPAPHLLDVLGTPLDDLIGDGWDRPRHPTAVGVGGTGETIWVDLLRDGGDPPHGTIVGPRAERDRVLRTLLFSLALGHSPATTTLAFADFSGGASFVGLGSLPHVVTAVHSMSIDSPLFPRLLTALETERVRRENLQSQARTRRDQDPAFPVLVVVIDNLGPLLGARPELQDPLFRLCEEGPAQGIRFVLCSPDETDLPFPPRWRITVPGPDGGDSASLTTGAEAAPVTFRPAHIALTDSDPIVERMRQRGPRAPRLPWPDEPTEPAAPAEPAATVQPSSGVERPPPPRPAPADDVLELNGAGLGAAFTNAWKLPISIPRPPRIGHDPEGNEFAAPSLDLAAGGSGLVVGDGFARRHILRVIALALGAKYPPSQMTFAFAGLGEHPLGDALPLPHVLYSEEELLGRPHKLQEFIDFLSAELDTRRGHASLGDLPHLVVMADVSLTFPSGRREVGETLLQLAQRGGPLGVRLILASSTVENTTIWSRFLPLLGWRIAANRLPPAELRTVLGQASLSFPDGDAYFMATGDAPRRFTPARLPSERGVAAFAEQAAAWARPAAPPAPEASASDLPDVLRASELPEVRGRRIPIGIADRTHEPVLLDLEADRHLLISGPSDTGRAALVRRLIREIAARHPVQDRAIYLLDPRGRLSEFAAGLTRDVLTRYGCTQAEMVEIVGAVMGNIALRRRIGQGIDIYLVVTGRLPLEGGDPLLPLLPSLEQGSGDDLHLILNQHESPAGVALDPVTVRLHWLGAPAVLTGYSGQEARLWGVPAPPGGRGPRGRATFSRRGSHRLMQIAEPD
ncbi:SAV_2336 N-terminal domain-related protein [Actinomadura nitritigenes]|uniref:SAV_2336 N-terminal domain-related protein n=1 Tax=Actinomadura nitritigenes TaxID=134602 RepID=UPI003D8FE9F7